MEQLEAEQFENVNAFDDDPEEEQELDEDDEDEEEEDEEGENNPLGVAPPIAPGESASTATQDPMKLTDQEVAWAWAIKTAIEQDPELDNLTDFMYAQLALNDGGNLEAALERVTNLQYFREEYKVVDNLQEGKRWTTEWLTYARGVVCSFSYHPAGGNYCLVYDLSAVDTSMLRRGLEMGMVGGYYLCHAMSPDFR